jgi:TetR/AcrR family transcriptional regulator, mexJK operon transcriptional repressor
MTDAASGNHHRRARRRTDRKALGRVGTEQAGCSNAEPVDRQARDHGVRAPSGALLDGTYPECTDDGEQAATIIVEWIQPPAPLASKLSEWMPMSKPVPAALQELARSYIDVVMNPELLRRRQLVLREAGRFPDLARKYHESGPRRTIDVLTTAFARLAERGELVIEDPRVAATQFAFLVVGEPLDTAMFRGVGRRRTRQLHLLADAGVEVFLAAYGRKNRTMRLRGRPNSNS